MKIRGGSLVCKQCPTLTNPWTIALQGFSRQEYWSGLPFPSPGDLPNPGIELRSPASRQILYHLSFEGSPPKSGDLILIKETKMDIETTNGFCHIQVYKKETNPLVAQLVKIFFTLKKIIMSLHIQSFRRGKSEANRSFFSCVLQRHSILHIVLISMILLTLSCLCQVQVGSAISATQILFLFLSIFLKCLEVKRKNSREINVFYSLAPEAPLYYTISMTVKFNYFCLHCGLVFCDTYWPHGCKICIFNEPTVLKENSYYKGCMSFLK